MMRQHADPAGVHLDHVGFIVRDLNATAALMTRLGFTLTARADHTRTNERGELVSAGSAQRSIMLGTGYIELMEIHDPAAGHQLAAATGTRYGLHIVAYGTTDAQACHDQCLDRGVDAGPLLRWARPINEDGLHGMAQFAYFGSAWQPTDPSYLCWVQHLTPQLLRSPQLVAHANGALGVTGLTYRGPRPSAAGWVQRLMAGGATLLHENDHAATLTLPNARLDVGFDETVNAVQPVALHLAVADGQALRHRCAECGISVAQGVDSALDIDLTQQLGLHLICTESASTLA